ncbi:MAG: hypothetical protein MUC97_13555 [Bernardetiaceae bacterium]|jgi:hypothetical protein|nr:hypothetical protein [Bernardetiaceae bacterium]
MQPAQPPDGPVEAATQQLATQYFEVPPQAELFAALSRVIGEWLDHDFGRLLNAMYRLDVDEAKFKLALTSGQGESVAHNVAALVLARLRQKAETRLKYTPPPPAS